MREAVFIFGPQGSGKGTQAKILAERLGYHWFEMSEAIREYAAGESEEAKAIRDQIARGDLLNDEDIMKVINQLLPRIPAGGGVISDGAPRTLPQARLILSWLKEHRYSRLTTIFLSVPREISEERLKKRAEIEHRVDDTPERIAHRLDLYEKETSPILDFLKLHTDFKKIDGEKPVHMVTEEISRALGLI